MKIKSIVTLLGALVCVSEVSAWSITPSSKQIGADGGSFTLTVSGTEYYDWSGGSSYDWITVTRESNTKFTVKVAATDTYEDRYGSVGVSAFQGGSTHNAQTYVNARYIGITQSGYDLSVSPETISIAKEGGTAEIAVCTASSVKWTVDESISWLCANVSSGKGNSTVTLSVSENTGYEPRSGTVTIAGKTISITQASVTGLSKIVYVNLHGAENPNPSYYKEGVGLVLSDLEDVEGYVFNGWTPAIIDGEATGRVEVVAHWLSTNYCAVLEVEARQRYPWSGKVDVSYVITGDMQQASYESGYKVAPILCAEDLSTGVRSWATVIEGELSLEERRHNVVWDMERQGVHLASSNVVFHVCLERRDPIYCVVDLSQSDGYITNRIEYLDGLPDDGWDSSHKTTKLVMRRIEPGMFQMQNSIPVKFSNFYYISVFEFTAGQNARVNDLSSESCLALNGITYNEIRGSSEGSKWPTASAVDGSSIIGKLRAKTGLMFDLPTEAQWECAYRAGTTTIYPWGDEYYDSAASEYISDRYEWYTSNTAYGKVHEVGLRLPNQFGLYDMGGNVCEWCLDWYGEIPTGGIDPVGPTSGQYRVSRGGHGGSYIQELTSSYRKYGDPSLAGDLTGFRVSWTPPPDKIDWSNVGGVSASVSIDTETVTHAPSIEVAYSGNDEISVIMSWENDWPIHYVVDGTDPTLASPIYTNAITLDISGAKTIKARAFGPNNETSEISTYEIAAPNAPTISPVDGTIIGSSVSVNISSDNPNATIYCTTDGTEPTTSSTVYKRFKASTKMTVKAIAVVDGMAWSETTTARYALGQCADPAITPTDGTVFDSSKYQVSIAKNGEKGVLRYTTDGSEPTESSPIYTAPFTISATTTIKAKTFDTEYFDSAIVCATLTRQWTKVATPVIHASETFSGTKQTVSLTCETEDSVIRYTTDGSEPNSHSKKYSAAFDVTGTTVVKAIAFKTDCTASDIATMEITKQWGIGDAMNDSDRHFATNAETGWLRDTTVSHDGSESMKSGNIEDSSTTGIYSESVLSTTVEGEGIVSFWWKASCEEDESFEWDHGEFRIDGTVVTNINGTAGWIYVSHEITSSGSHTLSWVYCKDDFGFEEGDCIWVDEFGWQVNDPIPELGDNPTPQQVASALEGSTDSRLAQNITDGAGYEKYRAWVGKVKALANGDPIGAEAVKSSSHAWLSFALDSATLIETAPDEDDVQIESFAPSGTEGRFDFTVGVENVDVGSEATAENLNTIFGLEGGSSLTNMSSSNVELTFGTPENGKVKFLAGPKDTTQSTFFMKVRMTP